MSRAAWHKSSNTPNTLKPSRRPIILWDTETTGLGPAKNSLVEIGLMELRCTAPTTAVYSFSSLIHPVGVSMPRAASRVHGITNPMMQDAPHFPEVWAGVTEYVHQVAARRGRPLLVAHNLPFDLSFLKEELRRIGLPLPDWDFACSLRDVAHVLWPGQKASLASLADRFSIVNEEAHRALCDVEATGKILEEADNELREAARKQGIPLKPKGEYIREMLEKAALKRRFASQGQTLGQSTQVFSKYSDKQPSSSAPSSSSFPTNAKLANAKHDLQQYYVTPTGSLWHSSRGCENLDLANAILRVMRRPFGKLPCCKCNLASPSKKEPAKESPVETKVRAIAKKSSSPRRSVRISAGQKR